MAFFGILAAWLVSCWNVRVTVSRPTGDHTVWLTDGAIKFFMMSYSFAFNRPTTPVSIGASDFFLVRPPLWHSVVKTTMPNPGGAGTMTIMRCEIPLWYLLVAFGLVGGISHWCVRRRELVIQMGVCRYCGYDLRESPERCPECGEKVQTKKSGN